MNDERPAGHELQSPASKERGKRFGRGRDLFVYFLFGLVAGLVVVYLFWIKKVGQPRELDHQPTCGMNLHGIGQGIALYAYGHNDAHPGNLGELIEDGTVSQGMLLCPSTGRRPITTTRFSEMGENGDYVYVAGLTNSAPDDLIMAYELPANHGQEGVNILYVAGNVKLDKRPVAFMNNLQRTHEFLAQRKRGQP